MKTFNFEKKEYVRFERLCKKYGLDTQHDCTFVLTVWLSELESHYYRVMKNNKTIALVNLIQEH